ncbi:MAG: septation protein A [Burkholderiales bacterium]|nr:septation protein A [Burkholderiales bacterium]OUT76767.1 MAG: septation protein A [Betaproteobacteria bacterium TMED22]
MKFFFEIFPIIIFFFVFKSHGIMAATAAAIIATIIQAGWSWLRNKKIEKMMMINLGIIIILGGATIALQDETFIKWKPTVLYWAFAIILVLSNLIFKKNLIKAMMGSKMIMVDPLWNKLNLSWSGFFLFMGCLNLYVAFNFDTDMWVNFKLFGGMGLLLIFALAQAFFLSKHISPQEDE